jgi:phosphatidylserine/phosphatidylglycerophosphate/cardiolipin synthase-like enzyme
VQQRWRHPLLGILAVSIASLSIYACSSAELKTAPSPGGGTSSGDPASDPDGGGAGSDGGRDPRADLDGGAIPVTSAVTIQVMPSDSGKAVLDAITGAQKSVHMTMYLLTDTDVINALKSRKSAGKDVKVVLNQSFPPGQEGSNDSVFASLSGAGVDVVWAPPGYTFTHAKTVIIDAAKVLIMTMNLTHTSADQNREYIATDTDPQDVADAETLFQGDYTNQSTTVTGKLLVAPRSSSPIDAQKRLKALIDSATSTLDIEGETLSDTGIVDAIIAAQKAGVAVRVVIDEQTGTSAQQNAVAKLKAAGVPIKALGNPTMHAKAIVADKKLAYVGSMNFTANSLFDNREIGVITDAATEVLKVQSTIGTDFGAADPL